MELRVLRYFLAIAREENMTKARFCTAFDAAYPFAADSPTRTGTGNDIVYPQWTSYFPDRIGYAP